MIHLDYEVFSETDLTEAGVFRYAEDPSTEIISCSFAFDDGPINLWIPYDDVPPEVITAVKQRYPDVLILTSAKCPAELARRIQLGEEIRAHNAQFERVITNGPGKKNGIPPIRIKQTVCVAVKAAAMGLPRKLEDAAKALGLPGKDEGGRIAMLQITKPRKPTKADPSTRWTMQNAPDKWIAMFCYSIADTPAERSVDDALPDLDPNEQKLYWLDQKINERGWAVDLEAVNNILFVVEQYKEQLAAECEELTRDWLTGVGLKPTQREKIADWVRANGYDRLTDMQAETIRRAVKSEPMPENVKRVLLIYSTYNAKSVSKLDSMLRAVCADGRLRGMFVFHGAGPGRWSSMIVQLQNFMRPVIKDPNTAIEAFAARSLELILMLYPDVDPMKVAGSCMRGCLVASEGHDLVFPDFSGIEDRVNLWFFDEEKMLEVYRAYDEKRGRHPYSVTVCNAFGLDLATFSDEDPRRQWGKVMRLALGYEGGVEAFVTMVETYGIDLEEMAAIVNPLLPEDAVDHAKWMWENHPSKQPEHIDRACNGLKYLYRQNQPGIKQGWKLLKEAAEKAVEFEGEVFWIPNKKIGFRVETYKGRKWLCMRLPSGRRIKYYAPEWHPAVVRERWINNELQEYVVPGYFDYMGVDTYTRQWMRLQTYGGKLDENADQGFSRDLLCNALLNMDAAGIAIVGSEHDKAITEIPARTDVGGVDFKMLSIKGHMKKQPAYADGLPLATDGKRCKRYGK